MKPGTVEASSCSIAVRRLFLSCSTSSWRDLGSKVSLVMILEDEHFSKYSAVQGAWQRWDSLEGGDGEYIFELCSDEACDLHNICLVHVKLSWTRVTREVKHQLQEETRGGFEHHARIAGEDNVPLTLCTPTGGSSGS